MENDITAAQAFRAHFAFWTKKKEYGNKPLTMQHVLTSILVLGFGLILSVIVFILEVWPCLTKKIVWVKPIPENLASDKDLKIGTGPLTTRAMTPDPPSPCRLSMRGLVGKTKTYSKWIQPQMNKHS